MSDLAIIIPAYKKDFFFEALESLSKQTNKDFHLYIGDDNSPDDLESIVNCFLGSMAITYKKFDINLGKEDLVRQWTRCVNLSQNENWIWLFSDDDVADVHCVQQFYNSIKNGKKKIDVYRFNTTVIDNKGNEIGSSPVGPEYESCEDMAYNLLMGKRGNSMPDHIFSRKVYSETGGFVNTAFGQGADWATSMKFAKKNGIGIIPEAIIKWRQSGINLSSLASSKEKKMIYGFFEFIDWVLDFFKYLDTEGGPKYSQIKKAALTNLISVFTYHYKGVSGYSLFYSISYLKRKFDLSLIQSVKIILQINNHAKKI
jgi:glycosyltransferase involved in cell wall biosynthesis